jgi:tRNA pseudouridine55 synthase
LRAEFETEGGGFVLNVYKEIPWTSHDAVSRVRRILNTHAVGHAGSLDPFATGVLIVAVGRATKLVPYLMEQPKGYRGTLVFGRRTSTGDSAGEQIAEGPVPQVGVAEVQEAADTFIGCGMQIPPMVSAIKHEGRRLYDLARKGIEVARQPRPVVISRFAITGVDLPRVDFEVDCGRGTYVRTLVEDLAARCGSTAFVESLTRLRVGEFEVGDSCRLISPPCSEREGLLARGIRMSEAVVHLAPVHVESRWVHRLRQGAIPPWKGLRFEFPPRVGSTVRLIGPEKDLLAIATVELLPGPADRPVEQACSIRLDRVF